MGHGLSNPFVLRLSKDEWVGCYSTAVFRLKPLELSIDKKCFCKMFPTITLNHLNTLVRRKMIDTIVVNSELPVGRPCIAGMRINVQSIHESINEGITFDQIIFPPLTKGG
jgi:uncharacterized protein (DUF433 family)